MNRGREGLLGRHQQAHDERGHIEHVDRRRDRIRRGRGWRHHRPRAPERLVLMTAFAAVVDVLFADPNIGCEAVYTSEGGAPALVRIVSRQAVDSDQIMTPEHGPVLKNLSALHTGKNIWLSSRIVCLPFCH